MKIKRLTLERYGKFEDAAFEFGGPEIRLHVVFGENEAGKSTLLDAIADLLFGIPARTPYNFKHEYSRLRLAAEIVSRAGHKLAFRRRKATSGTLLSAGLTEVTLPDAVLAPFTGGMSRDVFTRMFGLDHGRLREGGDQMLRSGGDLARSLFEAGSGLSGIGQLLQRLETEIDAIGDLDRRASKSKPTWREIEIFQDSMQTVRRDGLKAEEWRSAEGEVEAAQSERSRLDGELSRIRYRRSQVERIRRVAPLFLALDTLNAELASLASLPDLPPDFAANWRMRSQSCRDAKLAVERAEAIFRSAEANLAETAPPGGLLEAGKDIEEALENLGRYRSGVSDEPKLLRDISNDDALIQHHFRSLGLTAGVADVEALVPPVPFFARIRELILDGERVEAAVSTAASELDKALNVLSIARDRLKELPLATNPEATASLVDEVSRLGDLEGLESKAARNATLSGTKLAEAFGRLALWNEPVEALAQRPFPSLEDVAAHELDLISKRDAVGLAARDLGVQTDEIGRAEADLAGLKAGGEVPSAAAVQAARDVRDGHWRTVRRSFLEGRDHGHAGISEGADVLASTFETGVRHADELVDRRESDAQRLARFTDLTAQLARLAAEKVATEQRHAAALAELAAAESAWSLSGVAPSSPVSMRAWLAQKDDVLRLIAADREAQVAAEEAKSISARAMTVLIRAAHHLQHKPEPDLGVAELTRVLRLLVADAGQAWSVWQVASRKVDDEAERVREKQTTSERSKATFDDWHRRWAETVIRLGLETTAGRREAEAAIAAWDEIRQRLINRHQTARRLDGLRKENQEFRSTLKSLVSSLGADGEGLDPDRDADGTAKTLVSRLRVARERASAHAQAVSAHDAAGLAREHARRDLETADEASATLAAAFDLPAGADALAIAAQVDERRRLLDEVGRRRRALADVSDGIADAALRDELAVTSVDAAIAELGALNSAEEHLIEDGQAAAQRHTTAQHDLEALAGRKGVALAAQQARNAAQAATAHIHHWLRLTAAKAILERALERYRAENQHPLVRRGGEIFTALAATGENPIVRLDVAYGDGSAPTLVGMRADGSQCPIDGMSEGTRDQLYLSLRIAAVEQYVADNEPMPFIADDLFITSDERRVVPGLKALAELGRSTQVILFTHHRHVIAAAATLPPGIAKIHFLSFNEPQVRRDAVNI